ncbi:unnamed protein product [Heligmosomoides polygyrus]|uniref:MABP domain-containing protein n=1 Tax=Heligmosomoides polygyrus TaxID=6339 RepID=A0A183FVQ0_HELPZ|nr:unnamed protein product [Heligmosomoides polygyrus]
MTERELAKSEDCDTTSIPITALCIVSDKNKCPKGFTPITRCHDDGTDADLWRESAFSLWSRPVRYLAISREVPEAAIRGTVSVVTDITVVKDTDPIPHGFVAIDYCADSREKSLRKRFICLKTEPRDSVVDAIGEVIILNKQKKTPKDFTLAGLNLSLVKIRGEDGIPFKLNPQLASRLKSPVSGSLPDPTISFDVRRVDSDEFNYSFALERATLANLP